MGALGLGHCLVALTHECDLCPDAASLAALLTCRGGGKLRNQLLSLHLARRGALLPFNSGCFLTQVSDTVLRALLANHRLLDFSIEHLQNHSLLSRDLKL